jgi:hypothetical protein
MLANKFASPVGKLLSQKAMNIFSQDAYGYFIVARMLRQTVMLANKFASPIDIH